MSSNPVAIILV